MTGTSEHSTTISASAEEVVAYVSETGHLPDCRGGRSFAVVAALPLSTRGQ